MQAAATSGSFLRQVSQESKKDGGAVGGGGGGGGKKGGKGKKGKAKRDEGDNSWEIIFMSKEKVETSASQSLMSSCNYRLLKQF